MRIAAALGDLRERTVVEIGPGHGAITEHLATRCGRLHCIEFDPALARELQFRFRSNPRVTVQHADILRTDLRPLLEAGQPSLDVIGNLPYYITSDILLHLFAAARQGILQRALLMVQHEVAERVAAPPGSSEYGALSALVQLHGQVDTLFTLPRSAFYSTVLRLAIALRFAELEIPFEGFNRFLRAGFAQKRKTLINNLKLLGYSSAQLQAAWPEGLPAQIRAEAVPLPSLAALYRSLEAANPAS